MEGLEREIRLGREVKELWNSEAGQRLFRDTELRLAQEWANTDFSDKEKHLALHAEMRALKRLQVMMAEKVQHGKVAEDKAKMREMEQKRRVR